MPLYAVGLLGATRRIQHYADLTWQPYMIVAEVGAVVILCGIVATIAQLVVSIRTRERRRDFTGDPWNGRTLEWSTASPPPAYNFALLPRVNSLDAFWVMKERAAPRPSASYAAIEAPRNSAYGFLTAFFAVVSGFAMIWHIWWLAIVGLTGAAIILVTFGWLERHPVEISAEQLAADEHARRQGTVLA
jgi:cytochrome o ubiquinol oxidase subunit I